MSTELKSIPRFKANIWLMLLSLAFGLYPALSLAQSTLQWFNQDRPSAQAIEAIALLSAADTDGLVPSDYNVAFLRGAFESALQGPPLPSPDIARLDVALTASMERYLHDLRQGRLDPLMIHQRFKAPPFEYFDTAAYLSAALMANRLPEAVRLAAPQIPLYARLRDALAQYRELPDWQAWEHPLPALPGNKIEAGQTYPGIPMLARRLIALGDMSADTVVPEYYEGALVEGVRSFQERHGLLVDGVLGKTTLRELEIKPARRVRQIELTLERLRWTPLLQAPRMIVVNIPEFVLRAYEVKNGQFDVQVQMKIIVGRALNTRTPVFDEDMRFIEFSPYWNVPRSIVRSETIPRLRRDPAYFKQQGFEFVTGDGTPLNTLSADNIDALERGELRIRQRPGPRNALGDIKFIFPNNQNIYLHHTPTPELFNRDRRDFSHGCIRVEDPIALAKFVLYDEPDWPETRIRDAMSRAASRTISLHQPVRVLITYSTVIVKNDKVYFFPDLYSQDALLDKALQ
ncbi:L,D-transpeptidase family protein [Alcaligenaceae bacterium CGII-47]|nr:L,D-transpeptidase family protein [Alcaligenaceae bacterium CGII-47]